MSEYVVCVRNKKTKNREKVFGNEPGPTLFLKVPGDQYPKPSQAISRRDWVSEVIAEAKTGINEITGQPTGDILVFIHGYNNSQEIVLKRHRKLESDLKNVGYKGAVISYDWPSAQSGLNYLEDRDDAKDTARRLRDDCISLFSSRQLAGCEINVHLLGHSTGAYVIRHAFTDADEKTSIKNRPWTVSQIAFIGGDISSRSMSVNDTKSKSLYRHCVRLTNYQNPYDSVLKLSNTKRIGLSPRVGRVGLPDDAHKKAINLNCGPYFKRLDEDALSQGVDYYGSFPHSWHIGDETFAQDLALTIAGNIDRHKIPTRIVEDGELVLNYKGLP
ncbi:alpha/beta hydrolase [uncultured Desulfobacter sp.]|uniref:alpha/beta hydrolase n=1 Tax=uncultured Desulfobacter sp. TaxID=240139 RepID=UPI0029C602E6|nr:alpha/beta hydrolase [uncultured Desulfobacter sp.]